ncbi:DUF2382 domain-containing protein [Amycolatopsis anabasis]|uniref:DUF2382 domain-containing protein n=1 Tax=Amycolatopsis anabasis TaxID=1840409 RepID=UPI00131C45FC|nr:PRC and DUF2382 domain-containing protein [Amycolatopsis anabasis]
MTRTIRPEDLIDNTVVDPEGSKIGKVGTVYLADDTRRPEWVTVKTGMFGQKESFVPLRGADVQKDGLHVQVPKDKVSDAPRIDADGHLSQNQSAELYQYYGMPMPRSTMENAPGTAPPVENAPRPGPHAGGRQGMRTAQGRGRPRGTGKPDRADQQAMTRSEEQLKVGTEQVETGHVRLRKYVVTEEQQVSVPVTHEEVRVEREPITEADAGTRAEIGEAEQEVTLHAEKPVVSKETRPVEKVRLGTEQVTEEQTVSGEVRKERIDIDDDTKHRRDPRRGS